MHPRTRPRHLKGTSATPTRLDAPTRPCPSSHPTTHLISQPQEEAKSKSKKGGAPSSGAGSAANHVFLNIVSPDTVVDPDFFDGELKRISTKYWYKMVRLAVTTVELKISCRLARDGEPVTLRFIASNPTGFVLKVGFVQPLSSPYLGS